MELELQRTCLNGFRTVFHRILTQEETVEGIVPDTKPDMLRIIEASGRPCLFTKELSAGGLRISGTVRVAILYMPEGELGPRSMEIPVPVHCSVDDPAFHGNCKVQVIPRMCRADARAINPRKVFARTELVLEVFAFSPEETDLCTGVIAHDHCDCLQQKVLEQQTCLITSVQEKNFTFSDVFELPASRPQARELLRCRAEIAEAEAKVIGSRLVVKGEATLCVLYGTVDGQVCTARFQLPYSQIMEAGGAGEESDASVEVSVTGLECVLQTGEPCSVSVNMELLAQAVVREERTVSLLSDLYATNCHLEPEHAAFRLDHIISRETRRERVRQICECGIPVKTVVDLTFSVGRISPGREGDVTTFHADTNVNVLFLSEDDALCSVTYSIPATSEWTLPEGCGTTVRCGKGEELSAVPVTDGLEIRFEAVFTVTALQSMDTPFVCDVRELPAPAQTGEKPSVILRTVGEQESLWEIAKAYHSTTADIAAANGLAEEIAPAGMMLLIPRRR